MLLLLLIIVLVLMFGGGWAITDIGDGGRVEAYAFQGQASQSRTYIYILLIYNIVNISI
jgi:hypothetical protein